MNLRIPDFPLGALFALTLFGIGVLCTYPELPNEWLWNLFVGGIAIVCLAGAGLFSSTHPIEHQEVRGDETDEHDDAQQNTADSGSTSSDFVALIHAITTEGRANRAEQHEEDSKKQRREIITIFIIAATLFAVCLQVHEMVKVYQPIEKQAQATSDQIKVIQGQLNVMEAGQRPWIKANPAESGPLVIQKNIFTLKLQFKITNIGNLPAKYIRISADIINSDMKAQFKKRGLSL